MLFARNRGPDLMNLDLGNFKRVAANLRVEGEVCDLASPKPSPQTELDAEIAAIIQKLVADAIKQIDQLITELQEAKSYLQSEWKRLEQETARYVSLTQVASETAMIIFDAMSQWRPACSQQKLAPSGAIALLTESEISAGGELDTDFNEPACRRN